MNSVLLFFIIIFVFFILLLVIFKVYFKFEQPYCGGKLDSSMLLCNKEDEKKCNPKDDIIYYKDITKSLQYITRLYEKQSQSFIIDPTSDIKVFKGVFFFGIPDILRALPTDFGQNSISPYGFISFFPLYPSCISNKSEFCNELFDSSQNSLVNDSAELGCVGFLNGLEKKVGSCKFPIHDNNPNLYIENNAFFNEIGMLGAFSLYENQCVILRFKIPQSQLRLLYWSFNFYIADSVGKNSICSPTYQAIVASLTHSLNLFHVAAQTKTTRKNPFKDNFDIILLISYNDNVIEQVQNMIKSKEDLKDVDMVHVFKVPTAEGSLPLSKNLPNPNLYNKETRLFNPKTDRLAVLLRLTPSDNTNEQLLQDFINQKNDNDPSKDRNDFQLNLIEFPSIKDIIPYPFFPNPKQLDAPVNEFQIYGKIFRKINNEITSNLRLNLFNVKKLNVRNSLLNITAPLYRNLLKTDIPYRGGFQAVQLAGNMQGDNPDCQYRLGQSVCLLNETSILMTFGLNHQAFQNCIFNTYNVTDSIKAYGYEAFVPDKSSTFLLYLIGRSKETLNYVSQQLERAISNKFPNESIQIQICIVKTGTTQEFAIPYCHPMLNVERIYLNPNYSSLNDPDKTYSLWDIFGNNLNEFNINNATEDQWNSLLNITGPNVKNYIKPTMYQIEQNGNNLLLTTFTVIISIVLLIIILIIFIIIYRKKFKKKGKSKK